MITVQYQPLEALRPLHIALLAGAYAGLSTTRLSNILGLPKMILDPAAEELRAWQLLAANRGNLVASDRGARCLAVWVETEQKGFWSFRPTASWPLGKGRFFFKGHVGHLKEAGFDAETGTTLTLKQALSDFAQHCKDAAVLEKDIAAGGPGRQIAKCAADLADPSQVISDVLMRAKTPRHINQICRVIEAWISEFDLGDPKKAEWKKRVDRVLLRERRKAEQQCWRHDLSIQRIREVILASWLSHRSGLLLEISKEEPNSLIVISDAELDITTPATKKNKKPGKSRTAPPSSGSLLDGLKGLFRDIFR